MDSKQLLEAQNLFQILGNSPQDADTIPGRQNMTSYLMLCKKFDEALVYLNSIQVIAMEVFGVH
jgi:hypothetical protein